MNKETRYVSKNRYKELVRELQQQRQALPGSAPSGQLPPQMLQQPGW